METTGDPGIEAAQMQDVSREDEIEEPQSGKVEEPAVPFFSLFKYADCFDYLLMAVGSIGAIIHGLTLPSFFLFFGALLNSLGTSADNPQKMYEGVSKYALYFLYVGLISMVSGWTEIAAWMQTGERQTTRLRIKYLEAMLNQDVGFFDTETRTGDVLARISTDMLIIQEAISQKMGLFMHFVSTFVGGFVVGFISVWRLSLVTICVIPVIAVCGGLYAYALTGATSKSQAGYAAAGNIAEQAISQARIVYSFVGENKTVNEYSHALKSILPLGYKAGLAKGLGVGSTYTALYCSWALLFWYGGVLIRRGEAKGGNVVSAIFSIIVGGFSLGQAAPNIAAFSKARACAYQVMKLIDHKPQINVDKWTGEVLPVVQGGIEFCNVSFSYPSRPDITIFSSLCLQIPVGKTVAVVGGSGSGKSTIISLIERFYDPNSGKVLLDNHDIRTLKLDWLRTQMGLVNQEPALFATTIAKNILYGKQDASFGDIEKASKSANAHSFISQLPEGYGTQVGEHGVQLSGGQKQRVAIARAILKNPSILLLDEATSALDAESEKVVQDALDHLIMGRTTVIVAHRLSTIENADLIAVLQEGRIIELDTHKELIAKGERGAYASLVKLQTMLKDQGSHDMTRMSRGNSFDRRSSVDSRGGSARFSRITSILKRQPSTASAHLEVKNSNELPEDKNRNSSYFWRLLKLNAPEWPFLTAGTIGAMVAGATTPVFAFLVASTINLFYDRNFHHMKKEITKNSVIFVFVGVGLFVALSVEHYFFAIVGENLTKCVREKMLSAILRNEISWFDQDENSSGQIASQLSSKATYVRAAMGDRISMVVQNGTLFLTAFVLAFTAEWRVALVLTATIPLLVASTTAENMILKGFAGDIDKAHNQANMLAGEAISNIRVVAAFNAEQKLIELFTDELERPGQSNFIRGQIAGIGYGISRLFFLCSFGLALWYGAKLIKQGTTNPGDVIKAFFILVMASRTLSETISLTPDIVQSNNAMKFVFKILDRQTRIEPDDLNSEQAREIKGDIEFRGVDFYYPTRPEVLVFNNLNLTVHSGQSLAIVGPSGSGKSSIIALVERFYDPVSGMILLDGKDIRTLNLKSFRHHVGLVQQEPALFATSIYENILYGKENASESEVIEASRAANAHNFVSTLPDGYKTNVGERGVQLSGGQKQRVAIARAVLKNPTILLLDEATSALDAESEHMVQEALDKLMKGRTTIVIAHRLSTIRNADKIAVIQDGQIIEQGRHEDLVENPDGAYNRLINLQHGNNGS